MSCTSQRHSNRTHRSGRLGGNSESVSGRRLRAECRQQPHGTAERPVDIVHSGVTCTHQNTLSATSCLVTSDLLAITLQRALCGATRRPRHKELMPQWCSLRLQFSKVVGGVGGAMRASVRKLTVVTVAAGAALAGDGEVVGGEQTRVVCVDAAAAHPGQDRQVQRVSSCENF